MQIYADNCDINGKLNDAVAFMISRIKRKFNIKELGSLSEHVGASQIPEGIPCWAGQVD